MVPRQADAAQLPQRRAQPPAARIAITDSAPIVPGAGGYELVVRRGAGPPPTASRLYNFRSDAANSPAARCLILLRGFDELHRPGRPLASTRTAGCSPTRTRATLGIAGPHLDHGADEIGEAFTMLTTEPGHTDIAPYHSRQVALLAPSDWRRGWIIRRGRGNLSSRCRPGRSPPRRAWPRHDCGYFALGEMALGVAAELRLGGVRR